ncbi:TadE/TadG family type IV pilus assembly protein [Hoeflea prorocentri]|uniref:Tad domain-containing protein n=1 Tax=Hoeflea prorocentri TaxID=1922333 RepID=A0A9X3UJB9_9HYPH|nr:TadE/TadG family type IV pilus assembly protein [Hoeflea prorocentri]MCY6382428.1 Tad domain-containing protein [Hoeflea prorocentri]MDA5400228.1 Tad domain-containing protein [Hoeflea prorocentri]
MQAISKLMSAISGEKKGSVAIMTAVSLPVLLGMGALAVDVGHFYKVKTELQQAADIAALTGLTTLQEEDSGPFTLYQLTPQRAAGTYTQGIIDAVNDNAPPVSKGVAVTSNDVQFGNWNFNTQQFNSSPTAFPTNAVRITATLSSERKNAVPTILGRMFKESMDIKVETMAVFPFPPSFHMLSPNKYGALQLLNGSDIDIASAQINSNRNGSILNNVRRGNIGTSNVFTAGSVAGRKTDRISENQFPIADFLQDLPDPKMSGSCNFYNFVTTSSRTVLNPGTYCGGLTIKDVEQVEFRPGTYTMLYGPLTIDSSMQGKNIFGDNVLIYFYGRAAQMNTEGGNLYFSGPKTGEHAGVSFFSTRGSQAPYVHRIKSGTRFYSHGTFYAPDTDVQVSAFLLNGNCGFVCFVSETLQLSGTYVNYYYGQGGGTGNPLGATTTRVPPNPPALAKSMRPYIIEEL